MKYSICTCDMVQNVMIKAILLHISVLKVKFVCPGLSLVEVGRDFYQYLYILVKSFSCLWLKC